MAVCFPANQLTIIDYNRVVKDLNGLTPAEFLTALGKNFEIEEKGKEIYKPNALHNFALYLDGKWYSLTAKPGTYDDNDPIGVLDVTISSNLILDEILGIKDLRSDRRIDFVGGIRGLGELSRRVGQWRNESGFGPLSCFNEAIDGYCRYRKHYASEDYLVRTETAFGAGDTRARIKRDPIPD